MAASSLPPIPPTPPTMAPTTDLKTQRSDRSIEMEKIDEVTAEVQPASSLADRGEYRLYKRRFVVAVGMFVISFVSGMNGAWFGPISNATSEEFKISLTKVNWLSIAGSFMYLPVSLAVPPICARFGLRRCCDIAAFSLLLSAWIRYAGTAESLPSNGAFAFLLIGQILSAIPQATFQVLAPKLSENWYDLGGRTSATMFMAISNPLGGGIGQLVSPMANTTRGAILVLGIVSTVGSLFVFMIASQPAIPPTYAASKPDASLSSLLRAMAGKEPKSSDAYMKPRERVDFAIITLIFAIATGATYAFAFLSNQILAPYGYSADVAGYMGAVLLGSGVITAIFVAPLFDKWLTHRIGVAVRVLCPVMGAAWLSMIWAVRANNTAPLFVVMVIIGACAITLLPLGLELGVELTRNAEASAAFIWMTANVFAGVMTIVEGAMRASPAANPPLNLKNALILQGSLALAFSLSVFFMQGKQGRKEEDEKHAKNAARGLARDAMEIREKKLY